MPPKSNIRNLLESFKQNPYDFIENVSRTDLAILIKYASEKYYNEQAIISDNLYDLLYDTLKKKFPKHPLLKKIGATPHTKNKVTLPYFMGSMNKIYPDTGDLDKWLNKYGGPNSSYVLSDKLDGVSALFYISKNKIGLYKRGNGVIGTDISSLIPFINNLSDMVKLKDKYDKIAVRGEIIISKRKFAKYKEQYDEARGVVSGITNTIHNVDENKLRDFDFVTYEIIEPRYKFSDQFKELKKLGFITNHNIIRTTLSEDFLSKYLADRKKKSPYEIDGIIVTDDSKIYPVNTDGNPKFSVAFKENEPGKDVKVITVDWNLSKHGYIKPRLILEPTKVSGVIIKHVTAHNAKFVIDNNLGPGAIIKLVRSGEVIPYIEKVIKPARNINYPNIPYKWNQTKVDFIYDDSKKSDSATKDILIKNITFFFKKIGIKYIDQATITKMIDVGLDSIKKILSANVNDLMKIEGFEKKMAAKIHSNINQAIQNVELGKLMAASNMFGFGMGERKINAILKVYPNILEFDGKDKITITSANKKHLIDIIKDINGFDTKTATAFAEGLPSFRKFLKELPMIKIAKKKKKSVNTLFSDKIIVFTGFRNKEWEKLIEDSGGKVSSTVTGKTNLLVVKDKNSPGVKIDKAKKLGIEILDTDEFIKKYNL